MTAPAVSVAALVDHLLLEHGIDARTADGSLRIARGGLTMTAGAGPDPVLWLGVTLLVVGRDGKHVTCERTRTTLTEQRWVPLPVEWAGVGEEMAEPDPHPFSAPPPPDASAG